jgi:hypothetical protein
MRMSRRMDELVPYLFVEINKRIAEKRAKGEEVISFGIGDPDLPTPPNVIEKLCLASRDPVQRLKDYLSCAKLFLIGTSADLMFPWIRRLKYCLL